MNPHISTDFDKGVKTHNEESKASSTNGVLKTGYLQAKE